MCNPNKKHYIDYGFFTLPEKRKQGNASILRKNQLGYAQDNGFKGMRAKIAFKNEHVIRLHEKLGFKVYEGAGEMVAEFKFKPTHQL